MGKANGHYEDYDSKGHPVRETCSCFPRLTPASLLGMGLFFFFAAQLFTSTPFEKLGGGRKLLGEEDSISRVWTGSRVEVSKKSHAYLRGPMWNRTAKSFTTNIGAEYTSAINHRRQQLAVEESFYRPWIDQDLEPWKEDGITKDLLESATNMYDICDGDMFRFQILNGSLWVHHITDRRGGWYPAILGPENVAAKGRVPYALLALMDTLRAFPGEIPDLDAVFMTADFPCIKKKWAHGSSAPTPMFGYQGSVRHHDLPFPDYAFWGHEYQYLQDPYGNPAHGWDSQMEIIVRKYENVSLLDRIPQGMWRGRTKDKIYPHRDHLRRKFVECVETARKHPERLKPLVGGPILKEDAVLLNVGPKPPVALQDNCDYRYPVYIESDAYANNLKTKLACGSVLVVLQMEYWEFYARALRPGEHFVEVTREEDHVCEEVLPKVKSMNAVFDTKGQGSLRSVGDLTPTLEAQLHAMRKNKAMSELLMADGSQRATEAPMPGEDGKYIWGSHLYPWDIAENGQRFVREHLRMQDTLVYIRDLLKAYAMLQKFQPKPHTKATCYTGDKLIEQFANPHKVDGEIITQAYPWLKGYDAGCAAAEGIWGTY